jgi:pimeloyl-ACP methyl ester carboxylesterase
MIALIKGRGDQVEVPIILQVGLSPDASRLSLLVQQVGAPALIVLGVTFDGRVRETEPWTLPTEPGTHFAMWAAHDLLVVASRAGKGLRLSGYRFDEGEPRRILSTDIDVPIKIIAAHADDGDLEILFAINTAQGIHFGIFTPAIKRYQLITPALQGARFGAWNAQARLLGINVSHPVCPDHLHGLIYDYTSPEAPIINTAEIIDAPDGVDTITVNAIYGRNKVAITTKQRAGVTFPGILSLETGHVEWVLESGFDMEGLRFSTDGQMLVCGGLVEADWRYVVVGADGRSQSRIETHNGVLLSPMFCQDTRYILAHYQEPHLAPAICRYDLLTNHYEIAYQVAQTPYDPIQARHSWVHTDEQTRVPVVTFRSDDSYSVSVIYLHGGPHVNISKSYSPLICQLVERRFAIVAPNYPGSTGYGTAYERAIRGDWGGADVRSVIAVAEALARQQSAAGLRPVLYGVSYGGYLALLAAGLRPDLWSCVIACASVTDLHDLCASANERMRRYLEVEFGPLLGQQEELVARSPISYVESIRRVPTLIIHGANDDVCPVHQSRRFVDKLAQLPGEARFVYRELPDLGHQAYAERLWTNDVIRFIDQHVGLVAEATCAA